MALRGPGAGAGGTRCHCSTVPVTLGQHLDPNHSLAFLGALFGDPNPGPQSVSLRYFPAAPG